MFYTEALRFDITVPIYPLLIMFATAVYFAVESWRSKKLAAGLLAVVIVVWTTEIFIARDVWIYSWPFILVKQHLYKNALLDVTLAGFLWLAVRVQFTPFRSLKLRDALLFLPALIYATVFYWVLTLPSTPFMFFVQGRMPAEFSGFAGWLVEWITWTPWFTWFNVVAATTCLLFIVRYQAWQRRDLISRFILLTSAYFALHSLNQVLVALNVIQISWLVVGPEHLTWFSIIGGMALVFLHLSSQTKTSSKPIARVSEKYQSSSLDETMAEHIFGELRDIMDAKELYLDAALSLPRLAEELNVTTHQLSQTINQMADRNFFDFINGYRIDAAQSQLRDEDQNHLSVSFIGERVGFKSKSAFYAAFKKHVGCTPAEFRKTQHS